MFTISFVVIIKILQTVGFIRKVFQETSLKTRRKTRAQQNAREAFNKNCHTFMASQYRNHGAIYEQATWQKGRHFFGYITQN